MTGRRDIVVPGSIGNLGPGFDTLGLAVNLFLRARITRVVPDGRGRIACRFLDCAPEGANRIEQAFYALDDGRPSPSIEVDVRSDIPVRAGLGSSAAATIAGLALRPRVGRRRSAGELLRVACRLEGHPDNVAAALHGGLTSSCVLPDGTVETSRWRWPRRLRIVVATPAERLDTPTARHAVPRQVPIDDAIFNLQRVTLLLRSLQAGDFGLLRAALEDRWHQSFRAPLVPGLASALSVTHRDLLGLCLSGAGPSVAAFALRSHDAVGRLLARAYEREGVACEVRTLAVHQAPCRL